MNYDSRQEIAKLEAIDITVKWKKREAVIFAKSFQQVVIMQLEKECREQPLTTPEWWREWMQLVSPSLRIEYSY